MVSRRRVVAADGRDLRRRTFGFDRAPLPRTLALSPADEALNRSVHARVQAGE
jgi:hypothetical protein